jgi:hypothetical protein
VSREYKPPEKEIEIIARLIYEEPGGAHWDAIKILSPLAKELTRNSAIRVLRYLHQKQQAERFL